jgi:phage/plasmid-associated DNA primase
VISEEIALARMNAELDAQESESVRQGSLCSDLRGYDRTDMGNSDRFVRRYGRDIRYCHPQKVWYIWDTSRWKKDEEV